MAKHLVAQKTEGTMFSSNTYTQRRAQLINEIKSGVLLFLGNSESPMNYTDNTYHFRQDSTFLYYFGINAPGLAAVIDVDENTVTIFGDEMTIDEIVWMGRLETLKEKSLKAGVQQTLPFTELHQVISRAKTQNRPVNYLPPYRAENKITLMGLLGNTLAQIAAGVSVQFIKVVIAQRSIKSAEELVEIEKAVNTTAAMHLLAMQTERPGLTENDIAAAIHKLALEGGGNLAFPIILTTHGEILHNHYHGNTLKEGQLLLNDSGAETAMGYAGDMSRTFPVGKTFTTQQKEIYSISLSAHEAAIAALKPGTRYIDVHFTASKTIARGLKELGLMKGDIGEAVAAGAHALFFQCGTGHMMGLDVHDMEDLGEQYVGYTDTLKKNTSLFGLKSLRLGRELETGFVLTIEPGIYFIPDLIDIWKAENRFAEFIDYEKVEAWKLFGGLRAEEDFVITETGSRLLGRPVAKTIDEIEAVRAGAY
jgi:Xaa-Pro aminopeptidase